MSNSDRIGNITLTLLAAAIAIAMAGPAVGIILGQYAKVHQAESAYQKNSKADRSQTQKKIAEDCYGEVEQVFSKCIATKLESYYNQQSTNEDLKSQKDMAFWAMMTFYATAAAIIVASIAAIFAWQQVIEARRIGEAQVRAYVAFNGASFVPTKNPGAMAVNVLWRNFGLSPALDTKIYATCVISDTSEVCPVQPAFAEKRDELRSPMPPEHAFPGTTDEDKTITLDDMQSLMGGDKFLWVFSRIDYLDVFKRDRCSRISLCARYHGKVADKDGKPTQEDDWRFTPIGINDMT